MAVTISTSYHLPELDSYGWGYDDRGPFADSLTAATKLYVPLIQWTDGTILGMFSTDDDGDTWSLEDTVDVGTDDIVNVSGVRDGSLIRLAVAQYNTTSDAYTISYREYNMATDAFQTNANIPTAIVAPTVVDAEYSGPGNWPLQIIVVNGYVLVGYSESATDAFYARIATGGTSWTTRVAVSTSAGGFGMLASIGDSTKVHFSAGGGTECKTLDTSDWSWSTSFDASSSANGVYNVGDVPSAISNLGNDGTDEWIALLGFQVNVSTDWIWLRRVKEDSNGDLTSTGMTISRLSSVSEYDLNDTNEVVADPEASGDAYLFGSYHPAKQNLFDTGNYGSSWTLTDTWSTTGYASPGEVVTLDSNGDRIIPLVNGQNATNPSYQRYLLELGAVVESKIRPIADTAADGWDSAPTASQDLWAQVDEVTADDTDYIYATDPNA